MKAAGPPQTFTGPLLIIFWPFTPVVARGATATAAVPRNLRGTIDHVRKEEDGGVLDILQFRPQAVRRIRDLGLIHDDAINLLGDIDGVCPVFHRDIQMDHPRFRRFPDDGRLRMTGLRPGWFSCGIGHRLRRQRLPYLPLIQTVPGIGDAGRGEAPAVSQIGGLVHGIAPPDGIAPDLAFLVPLEGKLVSFLLEQPLIFLPVEGLHPLQRVDAVLAYPVDVPFPFGLGLDPSPPGGNRVRRPHRPLIDEVGVVDVALHIDPVHVDVQVQDPAIAVVMERDDILAVL